MNQQRKILSIILFFVLSFGFCTQGLAQKYSDLQTRTTQTSIRRKAIYPSKYGLDSESSTKAPKKEKETLWSLILKMFRGLIFVIALFLGIAAYIAKHKDKFKNIELPNALKNVPIEKTKISEPEATEQVTQNNIPEIDPEDAKIRECVFKFFEINK